jgi:hypothetical protein
MIINTIKYWSSTFGLSIGMSALGIYSKMYIYLRTTYKKIYYSNKNINTISNFAFSGIHTFVQMIYFIRMEPYYDPWCSICYRKIEPYFKLNDIWTESYLNLNNNEHHLPCLYPVSKNLKHINYTLFCLNPFEIKTDLQLCYLLQTITKCILNNLSCFNYKCLVIFKIKHQYITKISNDDPKFSLEKTRKHILCVEYTHPKMINSIYLDIDPGFFTEYNEILSNLFVERCLKYQTLPYVFDSTYKLKIMDCMLNNIEISNDEYMMLGKNDYSIQKIT